MDGRSFGQHAENDSDLAQENGRFQTQFELRAKSERTRQDGNSKWATLETNVEL